MAQKYSVSGRVTTSAGHPVRGALVKAFDRDLPSLNRDEYLGEAVTNAEGAYEISFTDEQFRRREVGGPDVYVQALDRSGVPLGKSKNIQNPGHQIRLDLTVAEPKVVPGSEYETLTATLAPLIDPLTPGGLTGEDAISCAPKRGRIASSSSGCAGRRNWPPEPEYRRKRFTAGPGASPHCRASGSRCPNKKTTASVQRCWTSCSRT